jgi:hypothetical protein
VGIHDHQAPCAVDPDCSRGLAYSRHQRAAGKLKLPAHGTVRSVEVSHRVVAGHYEGDLIIGLDKPAPPKGTDLPDGRSQFWPSSRRPSTLPHEDYSTGAPSAEASPSSFRQRYRPSHQLFEFMQFTSIRCGERLAEIGAAPSIGAVGDSHDNAPAETVSGYKLELIRGRPPGHIGPSRTSN